jgi:hypothetical protein
MEMLDTLGEKSDADAGFSVNETWAQMYSGETLPNLSILVHGPLLGQRHLTNEAIMPVGNRYV